MTMGSGDDELHLKLRIDTSQVADDLAAVDKQIDKIQRLMRSAYNRSTTGRKDRPRALNFTDVLTNRDAWTPEVQRLERMLKNRTKQIEQAAQRGELVPPPTRAEEHRRSAQERLTQGLRERQIQTQAQTRPIEITARAKFFDDMRAGLLRGLPNATATAASMGGVPGAAGAARAIMGLVGANPYAAGALALGAGALAVNAQQAAFQRQQASLASALVGGPAFGTTRTLLGLGAMAAGQDLDAWPKEAHTIALGLAHGGVPAPQLLKNLRNTLMVSQPNAIPSEQVTPLVAALGTAGGMNAGQINRTLQDTVNVAGDAGVSLQQLLQGMKTLSSGAIGAARDVLSLAAVQHIVGATSGINAGALMQGVMGATGSQALQSAALLGMSPQAFMNAQGSKGGMAQIWDRIGTFAKRLPGGAAGTMVTEQLLSDTGLLNMKDLSATQQKSLVDTLRTQGPQAAEKLAATYSADTSPGGKYGAVSFQQSMVHAKDATDHLTGAFERLMIGADNLYQHIINPVGGKPPPGTLGGPPGPGSQVRMSGERLRDALAGGMAVSTGRPGEPKVRANSATTQAAWRASKGNPVLFSMMMAQMAHESGFQADPNPQHLGAHPGYGIAQFTDTLGTAGLKKYLGPGDWRKAALDPTKAIAGLAAYDKDLLAGAKGNVQLAEARYNAGPNARADSTYGQQVYSGTTGVEHDLAITVTVKDDRSKPTVTVDHTRKQAGHQQLGHRKPGDPHHPLR